MIELQSFGQYRIDAQLGDRWAAPGLKINLFRATDTIRKRPALLILLAVDPGLDEGLVPRLFELAQPASELVHPHLAWIWETGQIEGQYYLAERMVQGQTLAQRLADRGPLGWREALAAVEQIAQGLDFAHTRGWIHGALTPEAVWLSPDVGAVVSGWGLQRGLRTMHLDATALLGHNDPNNPALLEQLPYLAPEVVLGQPDGPASDQYMLACLWFEMLTGQKAFQASSPEELFLLQQEGLHFPGLWPEGTPWELEAALERAVSETPSGRYASAGEFASAPRALAANPTGLADERARRAEQARQRREAAEQARRQAEEAARQAALEQARREIDDRVRWASQANQDEAPGEPGAATPAAALDEPIKIDQPQAQETPDPVLPVEGEPSPPVPVVLPDPASAITPLPSESFPARRAAARGIGTPGIPKPVSSAPLKPSQAMDVSASPPPSAPPSNPALEPVLVEPVENETVTARTRRASERSPAWVIWAGLLLAAALLGGLWWSGQRGAGSLPTPTPTLTAHVLSSPVPSATLVVPALGTSFTATTAASPAIASDTAAPRAAATATPGSPAALTGSPTATPTVTPTATPRATPTRTTTAAAAKPATPQSSLTQTPTPEGTNRPTITPKSTAVRDDSNRRNDADVTRRP